jgi:porphobilinogen synthase
MLRETRLHVSDLVLPLFINSEKSGKKEIKSMPGVYQWSVEAVLKFVEEQVSMGIRSFMLFGVVPASQKTELGEAAWDPQGPVMQTLSRLRASFGADLNLFADACFCEYTNHGHCGQSRHPHATRRQRRNR